MGNILRCFPLLIMICACMKVTSLKAQDMLPEESEFTDVKTRVWYNTYGNIRLSKRLFWDAQTHFRFQESKDVPFMGQLAQVYNRHAIGYIHDKSFNASLGGVLRVNFNTSEEASAGRNAVPEWRIWHQYQFAKPLWRAMIYHRIRIEHRWTQGFQEESSYTFRNRWRYMFRAKIPLNKPKLAPKTLYFSPEAELIMQSGKAVVASPMEDLRLTGTLGYTVTPRLAVAGGVMYSHGQQLRNPGTFDQEWTIRLHTYFTLDIRKVRNKLPEIHLDD